MDFKYEAAALIASAANMDIEEVQNMIEVLQSLKWEIMLSPVLNLQR